MPAVYLQRVAQTSPATWLDWLVFLFRCWSQYSHVKQCCENSLSCLRNLTWSDKQNLFSYPPTHPTPPQPCCRVLIISHCQWLFEVQVYQCDCSPPPRVACVASHYRLCSVDSRSKPPHAVWLTLSWSFALEGISDSVRSCPALLAGRL